MPIDNRESRTRGNSQIYNEAQVMLYYRCEYNAAKTVNKGSKLVMKPYRLTVIMSALALSLLGTIGLTEEPVATITGEEAAHHVGETRTVRGSVADTAFLAKNKDQPTFLNLDHPFPNYSVTVVIPGEHRRKFANAPETFFTGKTICVTGKIIPRGDKIQIVVTDPAQIMVVADSAATPSSPLQAVR